MGTDQKVALCVALAAFNFQIDATAVVVALPSIATTWTLTTTQVSMVVLTYLLAATAVFIPAGWAAGRWRMDRIFLLGCGLMTLGTLLCAAVPSFIALLACRGVQGLGGGLVAALGYAMIPAYLSKDRVAWGYGWLSTAAGLGMVAGAPLGGLLAQYASWRTIFAATACPIALLVVIVACWLPRDPTEKGGGDQNQDVGGAFLLAFGLATGTLCLSFSQELGWFSPATMALLASTAVLFVMAARPRRGCRPLFPPVLLRDGRYMGSLANTFALTATTGGYSFILPFYLTLWCDLPLSLVSLVILLGSASFIGGVQFSRRLGGRWTKPRMVVLGVAGGAVASALFGLSLPLGGVGAVMAFWLAFGFLRGEATPVNNALALEDVSSEWRNDAAVILPLVLNIGTTAGVSFFETIFSLWFTGGAAHLSRQIAALNLMIDGMKAVFLVGAAMLAVASWILINARKGER